MKVHITESHLTIETESGKIIRLDAEGRWGTFRQEEKLFRRTLENEVVQKIQHGYQNLDSGQANLIHEQAHAFLAGVLSQSKQAPDSIRWAGTIRDLSVLSERLLESLKWTPEQIGKETFRFQQAYPESIPILPPDRYQNVVVLPARGCPNSQCTFCAFYQGIRFRILSLEEFEDHVRKVSDLLGRAVSNRSGLFLGSASALSLGQKRLLDILEIVSRYFPQFSEDMACFMDPDHSPRRTTAEYAQLRDAGLNMVTLGLETGWSELRRSMNKSADISAVIKTVQTQKAGGMRCAITVLAGLEDPDLNREPDVATHHLTATVDAIQRMELEKHDIVYLSPLDGHSWSAGISQEMEQFREMLQSATKARIIPYLIHRFRYFA
ncbi:MAG: radical SAM protein [SAR324 cluster bacterium]|nr:radical SAM protein [SAR324 cluster bacterium]